MRFLFTMSSYQRTAAGRIAQSTVSIEDPASRRAIQLSREPAIFKLIYFIGYSDDPHKLNLVELDGIEPTASCLQSTRSPN